MATTGFDGAHTCLYGDCVTPNSVQLSTSACTADGVSLYGLVQGTMLGVPYASVGCFHKFQPQILLDTFVEPAEVGPRSLIRYIISCKC